ncbi:MAG: nitroreductase [Moraxellaceae bacterium]|nr:MAG: nitroreductase [Moraxellaceae bacterium]
MSVKVASDEKSSEEIFRNTISIKANSVSESAVNKRSEEKTAAKKSTVKKAKIKRTKKKAPAQGDDFNDVELTMLERRSVRGFKPKKLPDYLIQRMLETGRYAPCAGNNQSWRFVVVEDQEMIKEMEAHIVKMAGWASRFINPGFPKALTNNFISRTLMKTLTSLVHPTGLGGLAQVAKGDLGVWHGAPAVIFLLVDERGVGDPHLDVGIAGTNISLAAHSYGLGTCWVSFAMFLETSPKFRKALGLGYPYKLATSIAVGYPKGIPDGVVERETHEVTWYDVDGNKKTVY